MADRPGDKRRRDIWGSGDSLNDITWGGSFYSPHRKYLTCREHFGRLFSSSTTPPMIQRLESQKLSFLHYLGVKVPALFRLHPSEEPVQNFDLEVSDWGIQEGRGKSLLLVGIVA